MVAVAVQVSVSTPSFNAEVGTGLLGGSCQHRVPHGAWGALADLGQVLPLLVSVARQGQSCG